MAHMMAKAVILMLPYASKEGDCNTKKERPAAMKNGAPVDRSRS